MSGEAESLVERVAWAIAREWVIFTTKAGIASGKMPKPPRGFSIEARADDAVAELWAEDGPRWLAMARAALRESA